ncbi:hypothetical protein NOF55_02255 [Rhizobiaceae bacterium BDR2-2]|uniref:Lipoprotein n=1 Tax=Ectorhizobium quercum TaxID=2965071 RepID=A0AAE3SV29_9HYPH|nr:hypothetical protein [Ectorhizobium quercum]MCX8995920.1 hypothetical protein [Ectorhizobium quercum]
MKEFSVVLASLMLAGCANCNILSSPMPAHCQAGLATGMVIAAPVMVPFALVDNARDSASAGKAKPELRDRERQRNDARR